MRGPIGIKIDSKNLWELIVNICARRNISWSDGEVVCSENFLRLCLKNKQVSFTKSSTKWCLEITEVEEALCECLCELLIVLQEFKVTN